MTPAPAFSEPPIDYSTWYTKQKTADLLQISTKTVEQLANRNQIQKVKWRRPEGGPRISVYAPEDVNQLLNPPTEGFVMEAVRAAGGQLAVVPDKRIAVSRRTAGGDTNAALADALLQTMQQLAQTSARAERFAASLATAQKLWLTIPEAAAVSGLSEAYIRRLCQKKKLGAIRDAGWKVPRARLLKL